MLDIAKQSINLACCQRRCLCPAQLQRRQFGRNQQFLARLWFGATNGRRCLILHEKRQFCSTTINERISFQLSGSELRPSSWVKLGSLELSLFLSCRVRRDPFRHGLVIFHKSADAKACRFIQSQNFSHLTTFVALSLVNQNQRERIF